jgi:hypothetical protein
MDLFKHGLDLIARNAVKPFALYSEHSCGLPLVSQDLFEAMAEPERTFAVIFSSQYVRAS